MIKWIFIAFFITGCSSYSGIHNDDLVRRKNEMLKQDYKMKRQMQKARKAATPRNKRVKNKRAKKQYI